MKHVLTRKILPALHVVVSFLMIVLCTLVVVAYETLKGAAAGFVRGIRSVRRPAHAARPSATNANPV